MPTDQLNFPDDRQLLAAKNVINAFLTAMKNYDLYPPDHDLSRRFLQGIHTRLDDFLAQYGELKFVIEQKHLLYKGLPVYEAESAQDNFALILYRDGLLWLTFLPGLTLEEIKTFLTILNKFRVLQDEPEDDIVSALWDEDMAHIKYEAKEVFFEDVPLLDFSMLNKVPVAEVKESESVDTAGPAAPETENLLDGADEDHHRWWSLSPQEYATLKQMVQEAERSVRSGDVLQVLFFVLNKQENAADFSVVLDFLKEEWQAEIGDGNFGRIAKHLAVLKTQGESPAQGREWAATLLARFFEDISGEKVLSALKPALMHLYGDDPDQLSKLKIFLLQLEPRAITSLGKLLPHIKNQKILDVLVFVMVQMARKDLAPLGTLLAEQDDLIVVRSIQVLDKVAGEEAAKLIVQALRHSSAKVRRQALRSYIAAGNVQLDKIFKFIDDPEETTRAQLLLVLSRERNERAEKMLLAYLNSDNLLRMPDDHVEACFRALGQCGSNISLPFLERILLGKRWKSMLTGETVQQRGAVAALAGLQGKEAMEVLAKGTTSLHPAIRKSCASALGKENSGGGNS
jgi:hypothetical protein